MTHSVDFPGPQFPKAITDKDPATFPLVACGVVENHPSHVWIGAWDHGDDDPRRCPGHPASTLR